MAVLPKLAATSGSGSAEQSSLDPSDFASFALYCEVKLNENRAGLSEGAMPGLELVHVCFQLLQKMQTKAQYLLAPPSAQSKLEATIMLVSRVEDARAPDARDAWDDVFLCVVLQRMAFFCEKKESSGRDQHAVAIRGNEAIAAHFTALERP